jgi:KaiC/GvpD/RAD55 family RecA-like ATPase
MPETVLYIIDPEKYFQGVLKILETLKGKNIIYISANKPYSHMVSILKKHGIDTEKFFFIDCITSQLGLLANEEPSNCIFIKGPQNLTEISIAINECLDKMPGEKILLIDSISTLIFYNDPEVIGKFSHFFINRMQFSGITTVILALESDINKDVLRQVESLAEEVKRI